MPMQMLATFLFVSTSCLHTIPVSRCSCRGKEPLMATYTSTTRRLSSARWATRNVAFRGAITSRGRMEQLTELDEAKIIVRTTIKAPYAINPAVYVLMALPWNG